MRTVDNQGYNADALVPKDIAEKAAAAAVAKAESGVVRLFVLGVLAGAFISLGAIFATTVTTGTSGVLPFGVVKLLGGLAFSLGLILVVGAGAELFTGNNLIVMAWAGNRITTTALLRNWVVVYLGNFVGSIATAWMLFLSEQYVFAGGQVGLNALMIANAKTGLQFVPALLLGVFCNALVCLAVWLAIGARSATDKVLAVIFPITAFVAAGFEHCVANMYFIPVGLFIKGGAGPSFWANIGKTAADFGSLTWSNFLFANLLPVTIGNLFGGSVMVGIVYWFLYLRKD